MLDGISVWAREMGRPESERSPTTLAHEVARSRRMADVFEGAGGASAACKDAPNMAQLVLAVALETARMRGLGDLTEGRPKLAAWHPAHVDLPSMRATAPRSARRMPATRVTHSAATAISACSTFAAQNLNSGILPIGSSCGLVSRLAAASAKQNGMNTMPSATSRSARAFSTTSPRRVDTRMKPPGGNAEPVHLARVEAGDRLGLERVEIGGAPRHRAGVPVLEQAPGGQHHRVVLVGQLVGRQQVGRHDLGAARLGRERVDEDDLVAGLVGRIARIGDGVLAHAAAPR